MFADIVNFDCGDAFFCAVFQPVIVLRPVASGDGVPLIEGEMMAVV